MQNYCPCSSLKKAPGWGGVAGGSPWILYTPVLLSNRTVKYINLKCTSQNVYSSTLRNLPLKFLLEDTGLSFPEEGKSVL